MTTTTADPIHFAFVGDNRHLPHLPALILSLEHYHPGSKYHILTAPAANVESIKSVLRDTVSLHFYVDPTPIVPRFPLPATASQGKSPVPP